MEHNHSQENRIIEAAIRCINEHGIQGTTIRRIADTAEVNSAAISYYFRSKENLIGKAMDLTLQNAFDWDNFQRTDDHTVKERIITVFQFLLEGLIRFPGIARAHFHDMFVSGKENSPVVLKLNEFLESLLADLRAIDPSINDANMYFVLSQLVASAIIIPAIFPRLLGGGFRPNLDTPGNRLQFIRQIVEQLLK